MRFTLYWSLYIFHTQKKKKIGQFVRFTTSPLLSVLWGLRRRLFCLCCEVYDIASFCLCCEVTRSPLLSVLWGLRSRLFCRRVVGFTKSPLLSVLWGLRSRLFCLCVLTRPSSSWATRCSRWITSSRTPWGWSLVLPISDPPSLPDFSSDNSRLGRSVSSSAAGQKFRPAQSQTIFLTRCFSPTEFRPVLPFTNNFQTQFLGCLSDSVLDSDSDLPSPSWTVSDPSFRPSFCDSVLRPDQI